MNKLTILTLTALLLAPLAALHAADLSLSDPANVEKPPAWAVGQADRSINLDVLPGFQKPPPGFGNVPFYWWLGDPLTKERLSWQLDQLEKSGGVSGLQINYAHSDRGGPSWGLTYPSDPALFSEAWWDLCGWFVKQVKKRGMGGIALSDYTLGIGQGWYLDEILKEHTDSYGATVGMGNGPAVEAGKEIQWRLPENTIGVTAFKVEGNKVVPGSHADLRGFIKDGALVWTAPEGNWQVRYTAYGFKQNSLNPLHPLSGKRYVEKFFQRFEDRFPGEGGKGLNFFFSDELNLQIDGNLWTESFPDEFRKMKGYDLVPELPGVFMDIGPRTEKIRLDYRDVLVALSEKNFFKPIFDWHQARGMIYGCDHGGRGGDVTEFGDYFRTQRWNQGPGSDQPGLSGDVMKAKVASSMAHLYLRPRVWLEGFYGSGWGTTSEQVTSATLNNFVAGYNLLSLHGLYYSTHGGWWEWAPPCNHFRMPYWAHMKTFNDCLQRLSYLLSQGHHCCDVAVMYPVAPMQAGLDGGQSVATAFGTGNHLYERSIDFDYMDFESLARAKVVDGKLCVSGEKYRVLVLPSMRAVFYSTIQKAKEFYDAGGIIVAVGRLPEASERAGREDAELDAMVKGVFGVAAAEAKGISELRRNTNGRGGLAVIAQNAGQVEQVINESFTRDFKAHGGNPRIQHRKIGPRDVYAVYGAGRGTECFFRATGKVELWNPWTGAVGTLKVQSQDANGTRLKLPLDASEIQLVVFSQGKAEIEEGGLAPAQVVSVDGEWDFELKPTMDNRWGDFRWPPFEGMIGAEARRLRYCEETAVNPGWQDPKLDDSKWRTVTYSYGQKFWKLGPLPEKADVTALEEQLAGLKQVDPAVPVECEGKKYSWQPYDFSWRFGVEGDTGRQGYHGLKELIADTFIGLASFRSGGMMPNSGREKEAGGTRYYLWTSVLSPDAGDTRVLAGGNLPASVWLNAVRREKVPSQVNLVKGANPLLLRYDTIGNGFFVFDREKEGSSLAAKPDTSDLPDASVKPLAMSWYGKPGVLAFDARAGEKNPAGWYRFMSPPGLKEMTITARGNIQAWVDGKECKRKEVRIQKSEARDLTEHATVYRVKVDKPADGSVSVAIRVEQERGCYGGASLPEPVALACGVGKVLPGSWAAIEGLASYSGGACYRKTIALTEEQVKGRVVLNLGRLTCSAEVRVNGKPAGVRVTPPWKFDISKEVCAGENRVEVTVYNSLANHYQTIPTSYRGSPESGLLGPVTVELEK
jgi:hypothetical protein